MDISPPKWAKNAVATLRGWVVGNELVKSQKFTQDQVDEFNGVKADPEPVIVEPTPVLVADVVEAAPEPIMEAPSVDLSSMTKAQLVQYAADNNIEVDPKSTKAVILQTIQSAG